MRIGIPIYKYNPNKCILITMNINFHKPMHHKVCRLPPATIKLNYVAC